MAEQRTDDWAELYGDRDLSNPDTIKRAAVEGLTDGAFEYLAGASNDPEGNATAAWLERAASRCPKGEDCALSKGAVHCKGCGRNWPPDETWGPNAWPVKTTEEEEGKQ